jgi:exodeoxyribonuclease V
MTTIKIEEIKPINQGQEDAINSVIEFIKSGNPDDWFTLEGKAGTGKTTIITKVVGEFLGKKRIYISALSHKAKNVLQTKLEQIYGYDPVGLTYNSLASLLGMKLNIETGKFTKIYTKKKPPIRFADIIIVDEGSMINEEALALIFNEKKKNAKVIFLGDIGQLPPIRETGDPYSGEVSPVFTTKNSYRLLERVRQQKDSDILGYSDFYWDNSVISDDPVEDPVPLENRKSGEQIKFTKNLEGLIENSKELFLKSIEEKNPNIIKVVVYKNQTKKMLNWYIRKLIYGEPKEYEIGDMIMFNDNYYNGEDLIAENSSEVSITNIREKTFYGKYNGYVLTCMEGRRYFDVDVLTDQSTVEWNKYISKLFADAKKLPFGKVRNRELQKAWDLKNRFANIDYSYVITSHKSQGSTYKNVIVLEDDILNVGPIGNVEKSQSMYVAITRASDMVHIVSELN